MKSHKTKTDKCLNCDQSLDPSFEYCPHCGQENDDRQMSFGRFTRDFLDNYFSLDSRFGRSIKPFFLQPGKLTLEFMAGKRMSYANPIRMYLLISLLHFFLFSLFMNQQNESEKSAITLSKKDSTDLEEMHNFQMPEKKKSLADSSGKSELNWPMTQSEWSKISAMTRDDAPNYRVSQIEDSIHNEQKGPVARYLNRQIIKLMKSDQGTITNQVIKNVPLMMFVLMPIFALILKMFFSEKLYIHHMVHCLHLHSFGFLILSLMWFLALVLPALEDAVGGYLSFLILVYMTISFKNTYHLRVVRAIIVTLVACFLYSIVLGIGLATESIISLLLL